MVGCSGVEDGKVSWSLLLLVWGVSDDSMGMSKGDTGCLSRMFVHRLMKW